MRHLKKSMTLYMVIKMKRKTRKLFLVMVSTLSLLISMVTMSHTLFASDEITPLTTPLDTTEPTSDPALFIPSTTPDTSVQDTIENEAIEDKVNNDIVPTTMSVDALDTVSSYIVTNTTTVANIQQAIDNSMLAGDDGIVIEFNSDVIGQDQKVFTSALSISKPVATRYTIIFRSTSPSGAPFTYIASASRSIRLTTSNVTLQFDNVIIDGQGSDTNRTRGGLFINKVKGIEIIGANIQNGSTGAVVEPSWLSDDNGGAAIKIVSSEVNIIDGIFHNNKTQAYGWQQGIGGALFAIGTSTDKTTVTMDNCSFTKNQVYYTATGTSVNSLGGAIGIEEYTSLTIRNSDISENSALSLNGYATGGAIYTGYRTFLDIDNVTFLSNRVEGINHRANGGAIYALGATSTVDIKNSDFSLNEVHSYSSGTASLTTSETGGGGALFLMGGEAASGTSLLSNCTIKNNIVKGYKYGAVGGGIASKGTQFTMNDCIISDNEVHALGGATGGYGGGLYLYNNTFFSLNAEVTDSTIDHNYIYGENAPIFGGGVATESKATAIFTGSTINNNTAISNTSYVVSAGVSGYGPKISLIDTEVIGNQGTANHSYVLGGGLGGYTVYLSNSKIKDNIITATSATAQGAGIFLRNASGYGNTLTMENDSEVSNNTIVSDTSGSGSGIYINTNTTANIKDSSITNNDFLVPQGKSLGGGIYMNSSSIMNIDNTTISNNSAWRGGGAYVNSTGAVLNSVDSMFTKNLAEDSGGGVYNNRGVVDINSTIFTNNTAKQDGGAVYTTDYTLLTCEGVAFDQNIAENGGYLFDTTDTSLLTTYIANICNTVQLSSPFHINATNESINKAYNNYDINYYGDPIVEYTVTYKPNEGIGNEVTKKHMDGASHTIFNTTDEKINYSREGYTFLGWSESPSVSTATYSVGDVITVSRDYVLYAIWEKDIDVPSGPTDPIPEVSEKPGIPTTDIPIIITPEKTMPTTPKSTNKIHPKTGDVSDFWLWNSIVIVSGISVIIMAKRCKKS